MYYIDVFLFAFFISLLITPLVKQLSLKAGYIDVPNERKVHRGPISRLGGVAIYLGFISSFFIIQWLYHVHQSSIINGIIVGSSLIVLIGLIDDIRGVPALWKLIGQLFVAFITASHVSGLGFGLQIVFVSNPLTGELVHLGALSLPLTVIWIVGIINAINLIDGLDGLAAGVTVIAAISLFIAAVITGEMAAAVITVALIGSTLGFLRYNYNPASIFMGDTGSMLLGYILAVVPVIGVLKSTTSVALAVPILALGIPIYDTVSSIIRRIRNKQPIFQADGQHLHHRLLQRGFSHKQVVKMIYFVSILLSVCSISMTLMRGLQGLIALILIAIVSVIGVYLMRKEMGGV